jgi:hypothetical protein
MFIVLTLTVFGYLALALILASPFNKRSMRALGIQNTGQAYCWSAWSMRSGMERRMVKDSMSITTRVDTEREDLFTRPVISMNTARTVREDSRGRNLGNQEKEILLHFNRLSDLIFELRIFT